MYRGYYQCLALYIAGSLGMFVLLPRGVSAAARFTQQPPNKLYVTIGETARFVWDYHLDGGTTLDTMSPAWYFYQSTAHRIGSQVTNGPGKTWRLDTANCPTRLQSPTVRVSQESKATLVITNVTTADQGLYACWLILPASQSPVISKVQLIVIADKPQIDKASSTNTVRSWNGNTMVLKCKASGSPSPDFTWYKPKGDKIPCSQCSKTGSSEVTVMTGQDSGDYGLYKCIATNVVGSDQHQMTVIQLFPPGRPNMTVTNIRASSATVRWTKPVNNGGTPILDYKLQIISTMHTNTSVVHKSISGLEKGTEYQVKLFARNVVGYGSASSKFFKTTEEVIILDPTESTSSDTQNYYDTTVVAVFSTILAVSLLINIVVIVYLCRLFWTN